MSEVLVTPSELPALMASQPTVVIDTRNPNAYAAGHLPNAVNVHEIFTFLATSTPEGIHELKDEVRRCLRQGRTFRQRNHRHLRTVDGFGLRTVLPRLLPPHHAGLSQDQGAAWRIQRLGRQGGLPTTTAGACAQAGLVCDRPGSLGDRILIQDAKTMLAAVGKPGIALLDVRDIDRMDRRKLFALWQGFLPTQGPHPRRGLARMVSHDEADRRRAALQVEERNPRRMRHRRHHPEHPGLPVLLQGRAGFEHLPGAERTPAWKDVRMYFGSWNEWSRDPSLPIEEGYPAALAA